jgi:hypothetical protein
MDHVLAGAKKRLLFLPHAVRQMLRPSRLIHIREVCLDIENGWIIEDYPEMHVLLRGIETWHQPVSYRPQKLPCDAGRGAGKGV